MTFPEPPGPFSLPMAGERLRWCLEVIGWSRNELSRRLEISETTASQMLRGKRNIPNRVAVWVETLASIILALPKPPFWGAEQEATIGAMRHRQLEAAWYPPGPAAALDEVE